jgi:hypothetical protein
MQVALRVLTAINKRREPAITDVEELRKLAPLQSHLPLDQLACYVIKLAINRRRAAREKGKAAEA